MQDAGFPGIGEGEAANTHSPAFPPKIVETIRKETKTALGPLFLVRSLLEVSDTAKADASEAEASRSKKKRGRLVRTPWA